MYTKNEGGGDLRCASIRATVSLDVMGFPVRSVNQLYGPFPTTYTWGYYRSDVSCVFGKFLEKHHVLRKHAWGHFARKHYTRQSRLDPGLYTSAAWLALLTCLHAQFKDPREPPSARPTHIAQYVGTGLRNVLLWDLSFLAFTRMTLVYFTKTSTDPRYLGHMTCYAFGFLQVLLFQPASGYTPTKHVGHIQEHVTAPRMDVFDERIRIWYTEKPFTEAYALRYYPLKQRLRGCKLFSSRDSDVLRIQQNLTGIPGQNRQAAIALSNWVLADSETEDGFHIAVAVTGGHPAWGASYAKSGPVDVPWQGLPQKLMHGEGVCYRYRHA